MYFRTIFTQAIIILLLSGCTDEREIEVELMADCENHYRATSFKAALKNCELAAKQGIVRAQWLLGNIYEYDLVGDGANPELAFKWYLAAAEGGFSVAQTLIGNAYLEAYGVEQDLVKAYHWLAKAAEQGDPNAEFAIGYMYIDGKGRDKDLSSAISWFKKAAAQQHSMSINNLAWIYATSNQKAFRSDKKAKFWLALLDINESEEKSTFLDTKAAVFAAAGEFAEAIEAQTAAIASLPEDIEEDDLVKFQLRLESYQHNQAWTEE